MAIPTAPDNLIIVPGGEKNTASWDIVSDADTYNLYWKKDKGPNCYFTSLDDWTIVKTIGNETATIVDEKLHIDIPDGIAGLIKTVYDYDISPGDFESTIEISNFTPDATPTSMQFAFTVMNLDETFSNYVETTYSTNFTKGKRVRSRLFLSGNAQDLYTGDLGSVPLFLKVAREGTVLKTYYYLTSWVLIDSRDFGVEASNLGAIRMYVTSVDNHGGSVDFDNLIVIPSVKDDYDGVVNDIVDLTYDHTSLTPDDVYCYELTAENGSGESEASEEDYGIPIPIPIPDPPTNVVVTPGVEENNITWDSVSGADTYNLYWTNVWVLDEDFSGDLGNWTITKVLGDESATITSGKLRLIAPTYTGKVSVKYDYNLPSQGDFELIIDVSILSGVKDRFKIQSADYSTHYNFWHSPTQSNQIDNHWQSPVSGGGGGFVTNLSGNPTKYKFVRVGTIISFYAYVSSSWVLVQSKDFTTDADEFNTIILEAFPRSPSYFGAVDFDNLMFTGTLSDSGTQITEVTSPHNHSSLTPGTRYFYAVTAENDSGESDVSEVESGVPESGITDPPTGISVVGGEGENTITFTVDPEADETHAYWSNSPGVSPGTGTKISDITSPHVHDDLDASLVYYYVLTSETVGGESDPSAEYNDSPYPEMPENVVVTPGIEKNVITFDSSLGADSYNIYWSFSPGVSKITGTKITDITSGYEHTGLTPGTPVYYTVAAEDEDGESSLSSEDSGIPELDEPENLTVVLTTPTSVTLNWDSVIGATKYNVYWAKTPGVTKGTGTKIADISSPYEHTGLDDGDTYYYIVTAENASDESDESNEVSEYILPIPGTPVITGSPRDSENIISFEDTANSTKYNVYWSLSPNVTIETGTKIAEITSPYTHSDLTIQNYYYIVTAENEYYESVASNELILRPLFEGKIYNHTEAAQLQLIYQYQKE